MDLIQKFLIDYRDEDDLITISRKQLLEYLEAYLKRYEKEKHRRKPKYGRNQQQTKYSNR